MANFLVAIHSGLVVWLALRGKDSETREIDDPPSPGVDFEVRLVGPFEVPDLSNQYSSQLGQLVTAEENDDGDYQDDNSVHSGFTSSHGFPLSLPNPSPPTCKVPD